jgi:hypothetical protein
MKKIVWLFIDKKNSFVSSNRILKSKNVDWSSNWNITKLKTLCLFTFQICYWDSIYDVIQDVKLI